MVVSSLVRTDAIETKYIARDAKRMTAVEKRRRTRPCVGGVAVAVAVVAFDAETAIEVATDDDVAVLAAGVLAAAVGVVVGKDAGVAWILEFAAISL